MAEGVLELAVAISPEHIGDGHRDLCAGRGGLRYESVGIFDVKMNDHWRSLQRARPKGAVLWHLVNEHHGGITYPDAAVHELPPWSRQARYLRGTERLLVEINRLARSGADEVWCDRVHPLRNGLDRRAGHGGSSS